MSVVFWHTVKFSSTHKKFKKKLHYPSLIAICLLVFVVWHGAVLDRALLKSTVIHWNWFCERFLSYSVCCCCCCRHKRNRITARFVWLCCCCSCCCCIGSLCFEWQRWRSRERRRGRKGRARRWDRVHVRLRFHVEHLLAQWGRLGNGRVVWIWLVVPGEVGRGLGLVGRLVWRWFVAVVVVVVAWRQRRRVGGVTDWLVFIACEVGFVFGLHEFLVVCGWWGWVALVWGVGVVLTL